MTRRRGRAALWSCGFLAAATLPFSVVSAGIMATTPDRAGRLGPVPPPLPSLCRALAVPADLPDPETRVSESDRNVTGCTWETGSVEFQRPGYVSVEIVARRFVGDEHTPAGERLRREHARAVEEARLPSKPTPQDLAGDDYLRVGAGSRGVSGHRVLRRGTVLVTIAVHRFGGTRRQVHADLAGLGRGAWAVLPR